MMLGCVTRFGRRRWPRSRGRAMSRRSGAVLRTWSSWSSTISASATSGATDRIWSPRTSTALGRTRAAVHELPHDCGVLADARLPADRPQPSPGRHGDAAGPADELPGVLGDVPAVGGNARADPARLRLRDVLRRQVAPGAARPAGDRPVRHVADRPRFRPVLRLPQRRDEPVDAEPGARHEPRRAAAPTRRGLPPRRGPGRRGDRLPARAAPVASRPAVPALVRVRCAARAASGAAGVDRSVPRPVRRRVGRVAGGDARPPEVARDRAARHRAVRAAGVGRAVVARSTPTGAGSTPG